MAKAVHAMLPVGDEPNQQVESRDFTPQELEVLRVMTDPKLFALTSLEDKRQKTFWRNNRGPIGKDTFMRIVRDPWFIQQFRDCLLFQVGERLAEILEATIDNAKRPTGHSDRKMLLQILGIHRDVKEQRHSGQVDHTLDFADRLEKSLKRAATKPNLDLMPKTIESTPVLNGEAVEVAEETPLGVQVDSDPSQSDLEAEAEII